MLLFIALSGKVAAQTKTSYSVKRLCADSLIVREGFKVDTLRIEDAVNRNLSYPIDEQLQRNKLIFVELKK